MLSPQHPYWYVRSIVSDNSTINYLYFSFYAYSPQTVADDRSVFRVPVEQFLDPKFMSEFLASVPAGQEAAIHSSVELADGGTRHLVLVDMATSSKAHLEKLRVFLGDHFFQRMVWFSSGRSFHGYGADLLTDHEWVQFMGLLLLANKPRLEPTVDPRWIGHRLKAGYSALRWTKNTSHYIISPSRVREGGPSNSQQEVGPIGKRLR